MDELSKEEQARLLAAWFYCGEEVAITALDNKGTIVGFGKRYLPRGTQAYKRSGVYIDFMTARIVRKRDYAEVSVRVEELQTFQHSTKRVGLAEQVARIEVKIGEMPKTPFWEGDEVYFRPMTTKVEFEGIAFTIREIDYSGDRNMYLLNETSVPRRLSAVSVFEAEVSQLALVKHGNLWKMGHGEPMEFASIEEEARFYHSLGMSRKMSQNLPTPGAAEAGFLATYDTMEWEFKDAISAIQRGVGDEMKLRNKKDLTYVVIKYDSEEFGKRMRTHMFAKFGLTEEASA